MFTQEEKNSKRGVRRAHSKQLTIGGMDRRPFKHQPSAIDFLGHAKAKLVPRLGLENTGVSREGRRKCRGFIVTLHTFSSRV